MQKHTCGQVIVPTGGGKTYIMIQHALELLKTGHKTIVVVAPRILLANQLCEEFMQFIPQTWTHVCHAHSGETHHFSSTKADKIGLFVNTARASARVPLYSLHIIHFTKLLIVVFPLIASIMMKHTMVARRTFFQSVKAVSHIADRNNIYYNTSYWTWCKCERGMTNAAKYGVKPLQTYQQKNLSRLVLFCHLRWFLKPNRVRNRVNAHQVDADNLMDIMNSLEGDHNEDSVSAPSSKILGNMLGHTTILDWLSSKEGYQSYAHHI